MNKAIIIIFILIAFSKLSFGDNYYFVFLNTNPNRENISEEEEKLIQTKHLLNIDSLYNIGKLVAAGSFEGGGGIFVLVAPDMDSAQNIVNSDPVIRKNRFNIEIFEFTISRGKIHQPLQPFEMVYFYTLRFNAKENTQISEEVYKNAYMRHLALNEPIKDSILIDGSFGKENGIIQLFNFSTEEKLYPIINNDPFINQGLYKAEIRKLWIAKGTFCNK